MKTRETMRKLTATIMALAVTAGIAFAQNTANKGEVHQGYSETAPHYEVDERIVSNVDLKADLWNPRGKSEEQIKQRAAFLLEAYDLSLTPEQEERADTAREKYKDAMEMYGSDKPDIRFGMEFVELSSIVNQIANKVLNHAYRPIASVTFCTYI